MKVLLYLLCLAVSTVHAQWKAVSYTTRNIHKWDLTTESTESRVCFPDRKDCRGIIIDKKGEHNLRNILSAADWQTDTFFYKQLVPANNVLLNYDQGKVNISCYTRNVKKLLLVCMENDSIWHFKEIEIRHDGFQVPLSTFVSTWERSNDEPFKQQTFSLSSFMLLYCPEVTTDRSDLIIGDLTIDESNTTPTGKTFAWIDSLTGKPEESYTSMFNEYSKFCYSQPNRLTFEEFGQSNGYLSGYVNFIAEGKTDEIKLLEQLMKRFAELYPFYQQRGINKKEVQGKLDKIFSKPSANILTALQTDFKKLYPDPHLDMMLPFSSQPTTAKLKSGPLRLRIIGDDVVVAAVFNDRYRDSIPLGAKVISVDGKPVYTSGDPNLLLLKKEPDTLSISIRSDSSRSVSTFHIPYSASVRVGKNFASAPGVEQLADSVFIFRIGSWKGEEYYRFLNTFFTARNIKGIIIDLRGNGGGYSTDVLKTLSLFTDETYSIGRRHYPWFDESILVTPARKEFRYAAASKVIILADKSTACASEIFILGMKKRPHTFLLGDTPTMGAIASPMVFHFPSGLTVQLHTCFRQFVFDPALYTEGKGIEPDIWVSRTHARDLAPYEDKLMKYALQLIRL